MSVHHRLTLTLSRMPQDQTYNAYGIGESSYELKMLNGNGKVLSKLSPPPPYFHPPTHIRLLLHIPLEQIGGFSYFVSGSIRRHFNYSLLFWALSNAAVPLSPTLAEELKPLMSVILSAWFVWYAR